MRITIDQIKAAIANAMVRTEEVCNCRFAWEIKGKSQDYRLECEVDSDECWVANILYTTIDGKDIDIYQYVNGGDDQEFLVDVDHIDSDALDEAGEDILELVKMSEPWETPEHNRQKEIALLEFIKENNYECYYSAGLFLNTGTLILAVTDLANNDDWEDATKVTPEEWVDKYYTYPNAATEDYRGFAFVD